jgi:hypothetical protein
MRKITYLSLLLILITGLPQNLSAVEKKAQVGFRFLQNPVSAEAIAMGGMGVVGIENVNTVFWNPSGLGWVEQNYDMSANYTRGIADINYGALAASVKAGNTGVLALDMTYMDYGVFNGTRRADNEAGFEETGQFTPTAYALGLSYAQRVSDRFAYGVRLKYAHQNLGFVTVGVSGTDVSDTALVTGDVEYKHGEPAIDIGATYDFTESGLRFGAVIQNVSREVKYVRESFPLPFAVSFSLHADMMKLFGKEQELHRLLFGVESVHPRDYREKVKFGLEYAYFKAFFVRAGYRLNYDQRGLTFGVGLDQTLGAVRLRLDYAYENFGVFKGVNTFSVGTSF